MLQGAKARGHEWCGPLSFDVTNYDTSRRVSLENDEGTIWDDQHALDHRVVEPRRGVSKKMRDKLVGTWRLASVRTTSATGERNDAPYGAHPSGFITYTVEGRMSAIIGFDGRAPLSTGEWFRAPKDERAAAFSTFLAYAGGYSAADDRVIHHV